MPTKKKELLYVLVLAVLGALFFYKTVSFDFINLDDPAHTVENIAVRTFDLNGLLFKFYLGLYHPLTTLSFAVDWWLGGGKPWVFHLNNFIFHLLGAIALFKVCLRLWPGRLLLGFLISLTFLLHPLKVESVAWITERKDVLSGLFLWLTIYLYLVYLEKNRTWQYILANIAFFLSIAGKISVVPLPLFLFVLEWYKNKKFSFWSLINKIPFFAVSLIFGLLNVVEQSRLRATLNVPDKNYFDLFYEMQFYFEKFLLPWNLRPQYSIEYLKFNFFGVASFVLICFLVIIILQLFPRYKKDLILGLSLFLLFLFPNLRVLPAYGDGDIVHDRYMYIALTGLTIAFFRFILYLIGKLWQNKMRFSSFAICGVFVIFIFQWFAISYLQIPRWNDAVTLWRYAATLEPNCRFTNGNLGKSLMRARRFEEALPYLQKAEGRVGDFENLGHVLSALKRGEEAQSAVLKGLEVYTEHSMLLNMLGVIKYDNQEYDEAFSLFTRALHNMPDSPGLLLHTNVLNNLGLVNMQLGNYIEAEKFYRRALLVYKNNSTVIHNLGLALFKQSRLDEAKDVFLQELKLDPNNTEASNIVGGIFYIQKNLEQARAWFNYSLKIDPASQAARSILLSMERERLNNK